ncbi:GNAT family N-acetyltransferase [Nannocystaceae bacterium ST9]
MLELRPLAERDFDLVHAAMLDAFADYPIPMQPPPAAFELMLRRRGVVWPLSLGAFERGELVGYTLSARTGTLAYDLMTGVRRAAQGRGVVGRLFAALWPRLHAEGVERMQLEVITGNARAVRAYERLGFVRARRLISMKWGTTIDRVAPAGVELRETTTLDWSTWSRWWDCEPAWPSGIATVERCEPLRVIEARSEGRACGVAIACGGDLLQIAIAREARRHGLASALLSAIIQPSAGPLRVLNVDHRAAPLLAWLERTGAQPFIEQWEMTRAITTQDAGRP